MNYSFTDKQSDEHTHMQGVATINPAAFKLALEHRTRQAKAQIMRDCLDGLFTFDEPKSFGDLHDFVDANYYGDAFHEVVTDELGELFPPPVREGSCTDEPSNFATVVVEFYGPLQSTIDQWLRDGGLVAAFKAYSDGLTSEEHIRELAEENE